ncbi:transcriptional regulator PpsR [Sphingomonas baiyangensis]|uniref:Transcriptional regulator PpsR n=1 Tax=Sphingomonas baiyangensis TaxID=2572576 RepID=A0A4U1L2T3_9SPHN|nr:transcriptional regulator PpsR [Sphingomonas baiyangensis]TKD50932.1 transcriptional regulator PpsR [Sphingomonas baiyangensis]
MTRHPAPGGPSGFSTPERSPGPLDAGAAARVLAAAGDVTLILDAAGVILDVSVSDRELARLGFGGWKGRPWAQTVTAESQPKIAEMMAEAGEPARWRQVNHMTAGGDVPIRYLALALGDDGRRIAIGRDMRGAAVAQQRLLQTQQLLERDYIRLRQVEARYRMVFDMAHEAVLIVDTANRRVREANAAAHRLFGVRAGSLVDQAMTGLVAASDREPLLAYLGAAEAAATPTSATFALRKGLGEAQLTATPFRQGRSAALLLRIDAGAGQDRRPDPVGEVVERMPDAFVLADAELRVLTANQAFVELAEVPAADRLTGRMLDRWLGRPGIDLDLIGAQLREHGSVRNVASIVRGSNGATEEVELSGVAVPGADGVSHYGFSIRVVARRLGEVAEPGREAPRSVEQLTELVGRMPLKDIVRESTDLIERLCIEAALDFTSDNRASAAEILGLSRQSLYSKLHRHGLGSLTSDTAE